MGDGKGKDDKGHTTWSTYDGFSFDQLVDFPEPNKEVQLRRTDSGRLLSSEVFSGVTPNDKKKAIQEGRYSYYQTNQRFDTTQVLKFDGQASHSYLYDEFGQLYSVNKNDNNADNFTDPHNAYTFSGTQWDEETSLNYYGARLYDSWSGTWSTQDIYRGTIRDPMSLHRTAFVNNNPVNFYDPDGYLVAEIAAAYNIYNVIKKQGLNIHTEVSNYNFETGKLEQATINFQLSLDGKIDVQLDVDYAWRQGSNHGGAMLDVDAFLALDENDQAAYMASLGYYEEMNGKPIADIYMDIGNEKGWIMSGRGSSEQQRLRFELEKKARVQAAEKKLKTEANQIYTKSLIRQMNIAADPWIEAMRPLFASPGEGGTWITLENGKKVLIAGLEFTDVSDASVIFLGKNLDGSDATWLDYGFAIGGAFIPYVSGSAVRHGGEAIIDETRKLIANVGDDVVKKLDINITNKIEGQMLQRGWDVEKIEDTVSNSFTTRVSTNKANGNPATVHYLEDGSYVVVDDVTHDVIQVSDINDPNWYPDNKIIDPYIP